MSYLRAEDILPQELIEAIQQYVDGNTLYIPSKDKKLWGSHTDTRIQLDKRNDAIYSKYLQGMSTADIATEFFLSIKSIQRIIRVCNHQKNAMRNGIELK